MRVAIRTDANLEIGTGHLMRCLALAHRLRARGAQTLFVCAELHERLREHVKSQGFGLRQIDRTADWQADAAGTEAAIAGEGVIELLVVDHYQLDARWERRLRKFARRLFVIDDLANRPHDCDVLLDSNLHDDPTARYSGLVPEGARVFVGPQYALLREEFEAAEPRLRNQGLRRLLVFFGGTDQGNEALKVAHALRGMQEAPLARFVLGPANPHLESVRAAAQGLPGVEIFDATNQMAQLIEWADLGIGACGGAAWERCLLGLPTLVVVTADNQRDDARMLDALGAARLLGEAADVDAARWAAEIHGLQQDAQALERMSAASLAVIKGRAPAIRELEASLVD